MVSQWPQRQSWMPFRDNDSLLRIEFQHNLREAEMHKPIAWMAADNSWSARMSQAMFQLESGATMAVEV